MLSISQNVRLSVRLSVRSLLRYRLMVFLPPFPEVGCPIFLEIRNPWGKVPFNGLFAPFPEVGFQIFLEIRNPWGKVM